VRKLQDAVISLCALAPDLEIAADLAHAYLTTRSPRPGRLLLAWLDPAAGVDAGEGGAAMSGSTLVYKLVC
jgi:hypothetical protein